MLNSTLSKNFSRCIFKYFTYFCQKIGFDILCKLSPLHEMSDPVFRGGGGGGVGGGE